MSKLKSKLVQHRTHNLTLAEVFRDETGAIDLSSIMVGIIVIGLIGGVIAATVFSVIPWTQDNAAKHQLASVVAAQSAYMGLTSDVSNPLPAGAKNNSYGSSTELQAANLLANGTSYCTVSTDDGKGYTAFSQSPTGKVWVSTDKNTSPVILTGLLPSDCEFITESYTGPYVDPTPKRTVLTYRCDVTTTGTLPMTTNLTGNLQWDDGTPSQPYTNATQILGKTLTAGVTYKATFEGTYKNFSSYSSAIRNCLRSVDHWGSESGVTSASNAFWDADNLTDVPTHIPTTITDMSYMFKNTLNFNDPDIGKWDVSNVANMGQMFYSTTSFNQPLNKWNTGKVTKMSQMFELSKAFNQPLDKWNTGKVNDMSWMFNEAKVFNEAVNGWNTSQVTNMSWMFSKTPAFNQPLDTWNVSKVTNMTAMFYNAPVFDQPLESWNVANVTNMNALFNGAKKFNQPLNNWNVANVTNMSGMFAYIDTFNQPLNTWNVSKVTDMSGMFSYSSAFKQDLSGWTTTLVPPGTVIASRHLFQVSFLPPNTVTD